ncbi:10431_t:CDS:2, partial [Racocetra persica]
MLKGFYFSWEFVMRSILITFLFNSNYFHLLIADFTTILELKSQNFDARFENTFDLTSKGFDESQISFAKEILIDRSYTNVDEDEENFWDKSRHANLQLTSPSSLFTATPSRPFFPRGFY